jgi:hypothetical protein
MNSLDQLTKQSQKLLPKFIDEKLSHYAEPTKKGTPKGEAVGFSKAKYRASLLAFREKVLPETDDLSTEAKRLRVPYGVLRKWRSEPQFKELVAQHEKEFIRQLQIKKTELIMGQSLERLRNAVGSHRKRENEAITKLVLLLHDTVRDEFIKGHPTRRDLRTYQQLVLDNAIKILEDREIAIKHRVDVVRFLRGVRETL